MSSFLLRSVFLIHIAFEKTDVYKTMLTQDFSFQLVGIYFLIECFVGRFHKKPVIRRPAQAAIKLKRGHFFPALFDQTGVVRPEGIQATKIPGH